MSGQLFTALAIWGLLGIIPLGDFVTKALASTSSWHRRVFGGIVLAGWIVAVAWYIIAVHEFLGIVETPPG